MPRIELKKKEYMIMDLAAWIIGRMHSKGFRQKEQIKIQFPSETFLRFLRSWRLQTKKREG